jgi:hypothetical protein
VGKENQEYRSTKGKLSSIFVEDVTNAPCWFAGGVTVSPNRISAYSVTQIGL